MRNYFAIATPKLIVAVLPIVNKGRLATDFVADVADELSVTSVTKSVAAYCQ